MKGSLTFISVVTLLLVLSAGVVVLGVSGDEHVVENERAEVSGSQSSEVDQHKLMGSRYVSSKPMSVVHFVKPERYLANSGDTLTVSLTLMASVPVDTVTVSARAEKGLVISDQQRNLGAFTSGQERTIQLDVTVLAEGLHYINVFASAETLNGVRRSSYSVPIEVGNARRTKSARGQAVTDDQGNTLLLMPAKTTTDDK